MCWLESHTNTQTQAITEQSPNELPSVQGPNRLHFKLCEHCKRLLCDGPVYELYYDGSEVAQATLRFFGGGGVGGKARPDGSAEVVLVDAEESVGVRGTIPRVLLPLRLLFGSHFVEPCTPLSRSSSQSTHE